MVLASRLVLLVVVFAVAAAQPAQNVSQLVEQALGAAGPEGAAVILHVGQAFWDPATALLVQDDLHISGAGDGSTVLRWQAADGSVVVLAGVTLKLANMTVVLDQPLPPHFSATTSSMGDATVQWAQQLLPGITLQPGGKLELHNLQVQVASCGAVAAYRAAACSAAQVVDASHLFGAPTVLPGLIRWPTRLNDAINDTNPIMASNIALTCPAANNINSSLGTAPMLPGIGPATLGCMIDRVFSGKDLLAGLQKAAQQVQPGGLVILQLGTNISVADVPWPAEGLYMQHTLVLVGPDSERPVTTSRGVELDLAGMPVFVELDPVNASLALNNLCITNIAPGPDSMYPSNLLLSALWPVKFDRSNATNRTMLVLKCTQLVLPPDLYTYMSYWMGIAASEIPSVAATADWLNDFFNIKIGQADDHSLLLLQRAGQGTLWINCTLTNKAYHTPLLVNWTGIGELVPSDPRAPVSQVQPVFTSAQLVSQLKAPSKPYVVLMNSMKLVSDYNSSLPRVGPPLFSALTEGSTVVLVGRPGPTPIALDFGGQASFLMLDTPQTGQLSLQRLVLTGLGAYQPLGFTNSTADDCAPAVPLLGNLTSALWAAAFPRKQLQIRMTNTTLVVSSFELYAIRMGNGPTGPGDADATNLTLSCSSGPPEGQRSQLTADAVDIIAAAFAMVNGIQDTGCSMTVQEAGFLGIRGAQVAFVLELPAGVKVEDVTPAVTLPLTAPDTGASSHVSNISSQQALSGGALAGIIAGGVALLSSLLLLLCLYLRLYYRAASKADVPSRLGWVAKLLGLSLPCPEDRAENGSMSSGGYTPSTSSGATELPASMQHEQGAALQQSLSTVHVHAPPPGTQNEVVVSTSDGSHAGRAAVTGLRFLACACFNPGLTREASLPSLQLLDMRQETLPSTVEESINQGPQPAASQGGTHTTQHTGPLSSSAAVPTSSSAAAGATTCHTHSIAGAGDAEQGTQGKLEQLQEAQAVPGTVLAHPSGPGQATGATGCQDAGGAGGKGVDASVADGPGAAGLGGRTTGTTGTGARPPLINRGLAAAGDAEWQPHERLRQVIAHRKGLQGIDMQQIEFQHVLGRGTFGVVYKGKWRSQTVAIKTLVFQDQSSCGHHQRAITEAAINTLLTHPHIVNTLSYELRPVANTGMPDEKHTAFWKLYIVQEYCDGGSLSQAIDRHYFRGGTAQGAPQMASILQTAEDIARGMAYIHHNNVIHGDLSSGNIMLRSETRPHAPLVGKVGDFGLARMLDGPHHTHISQVRQGTPGFIAPEVLTQGIISYSADVWSFGVLLLEMYCGRGPWRQHGQQGQQQPTPNTVDTSLYKLPADCPADYADLVKACLAEDPKARPRFSELLQRITQQLRLQLIRNALAVQRPSGHPPTRARPTIPGPSPAPGPSRRPPVWQQLGSPPMPAGFDPESLTLKSNDSPAAPQWLDARDSSQTRVDFVAPAPRPPPMANLPARLHKLAITLEPGPSSQTSCSLGSNCVVLGT